MKNKWRKECLAGLMLAIAVAVTGCGGSTSSGSSAAEESTAEKEYVAEDQIDEVFTDADDFKGKYITLTGQVLGEPEVEDGISAIQLYYDTVNYDQTYIVYVEDLKESVKSEDYLIVDGEIVGSFTGETLMGGEVTCPMIDATSVTKSNYMDVVVPTLKELEVDQESEQNDCVVTLKKVEFAETETRLYMDIKNNSKDSVSFSTYLMRIIQDSKQIDQDDPNGSVYEGNYEELSYDISAGASSSGVVVFPAIDQDTDFQLILPDTYSDDFEVEFEDYKFDVSVSQK